MTAARTGLAKPDPLAATLVRDGVVSAEQLSALEAARVGQAAGQSTEAPEVALETALLEAGVLPEDKLTALLGKAYSAPVSTAGQLRAVERSVIQAFPRRLAVKHRVLPLELNGRRLTVAVSGTPDLAILDEIGFMLSVYVRAIVAPEVRVAEALAVHYDVPLSERFARLLDALAARSVPAGEAWQARETGVRPPMRPLEAGAPASAGSLSAAPSAAAPAPRPAHVPPPLPHRRASASPTAVTPPSDGGFVVQQHAGLVRGAPSQPELSAASSGSVGALADLHAHETAAAALAVQQAPAERRRRERVLWTVDDAIAELALADDRDAMLDVVLRFAYRRLTTAAIFVVQRADVPSTFVCFDMIDPLLDANDVAALPIPAEGPDAKNGALARVLEMSSPFLGPLAAEDPLARVLGRRPRAALIVPVLLGDRVVAAVYGDNGERSIPPSSLAELHMVVPRLGKGLGNLILRRKRNASTPQSMQRTPAPSPSRLMNAGDAVAGAPARGDAGTALDAAITASAAAGLTEEHFEVSAVASAGAIPAIEFDIDDALDAPAAAPPPADAGARDASDADGAAAEPAAAAPDAADASAASGAAAATAENAQEPRSAPWADGGTDDEDVRLDVHALAALAAAEPSAQRSATSSAPLRLHVLDDDLVQAGDAAANELTETAPPATPSSEAPVSPLAASPTVQGGRNDPVPSPGAKGRESLLVAVWEAWLAHEDDEIDDLVGQLHVPGEARSNASVQSVVARGERAMPSLARYFPGVLLEHPFGFRRDAHDAPPALAVPDVEQISDCCACLAKLGADLAAPILVGELNHDDRLHRYAATAALCGLHVPAALPRLAQRIFDPELKIAVLALDVLATYLDDAGFQKVKEQVRLLIVRGDQFQKQRAILAASELKDVGALEALIDVLNTRPRELADDARRALVEITKQDFGTQERRWRAWAVDNAGVPRTRWLIDGLAHTDDAIRKSAQHELNARTGQNFGYRFDASRAERETAVAAWIAWWEQKQSAVRADADGGRTP